MNILAACEFSGAVRDAFLARGHDAWSCDVEGKKPEGHWPENHLYGDCRTYFMWKRWDIIIAHPPCTFLANSSNKHLYNGMRKEGGVNAERWANMLDGAKFFADMWRAPCDRVCVENPVMHGHGMKAIREALDGSDLPDPFKSRQFVDLHMFGTKETKRTGLSLRGLPELTATDDVEAETYALPYGERAKVHYASPGPDRADNRSRLDLGLADAMAVQWGAL